MVVRIGSALIGALLLGAPARAQAPDPSDPAAAAPATLHGALRLSLEDALAMGLKNNLDVEVSRHDPLASWEEFRSAWGAYDPQLFAEFGYESSETPVASSLQASSALVEREVGGEGGVRGKVPWLNATYGIGYDGSSRETTSSISDLSPEYRAAISAEASIPLLRNLIWDRDWTRLKQTEILYDISNEDFRRQVMDTVQRLENAYWNLVATDDAVRVAEKSQETAEALLRQTKTQYEVGVVSRVEVTEAEAGLAERELNLIRTRNAYKRAQDVLMNEVLGRGLRPGSRMEIEPSTRPDDYIVYQIDVEEATHKAFENRPELAGAYDEIERRKIELSFRKNQKLPQLDLKLRYWLQGLSGKTNPAPGVFGGARAPVLIEPNYHNAHDDYFNGDRADSWSAMGVLSFPIGNRAAGHQANKAEIELRKAASQVARLRQGIILEVRDAARNLEAAQEGIEAAERQRIATEEQLRAERIRLEQGESTPFDVLLRERDLVDAEVSKIDALRIYRNSVTDLDRRQGTILRTRNILIDDVRAVR
jgi:outer membrane protein TolC